MFRLTALFFVLCCTVASLAALAPNTAPSPGPITNGAARTVDWGRPCTLVTTASDRASILPTCTDCGSGATAKPQPACTFSPQTAVVGQHFNIFYHSSVHHLYLGNKACTYTTEICPNATSTAVSPATPCVVNFKTAGTYYISDSAAGAGDTADYCKNFGANMQVTVTAAPTTSG